MQTYFKYLKTSIGLIEMESNEDSIIQIKFVEEKNKKETENHILTECSKQLEEYFNNKRDSFSMKIELKGTDFQKKVWKELTKIPYGTVTTYGEIGKKLGIESGGRAVGNANNKNPIAIVVPCHRVIGKNGKLTGYYGGLDKKDYLLKLESK